jgi:hypothetical protein
MKTVYLSNPVILRTREEDPNGMPPVDIFGQPAKNRDGSTAKPFKIVEKFFPRGTNHMEDNDADHPYIQAHSLEKPMGTADHFTIEQLEEMLAQKRTALLSKPAAAAPVPVNSKEPPPPLPMPDESAIKAMSPAELRGLIRASGGSDQGVANKDLVDAALALKAKQPAA